MNRQAASIKAWIEAMRLRTLPVSVAGVIAGTACAVFHHGFKVAPAVICLLFAIVAQIVANFANEYYDYINGLDKKGRDGFRRGVTEGDISPVAMKKATYILLALDCALGCSLIIWGGWWLVFVGIAVAVFALAYSTGPYPLSHNGLGDIAVIVFFGFVPVIFTEYVQTGVLYFGYTTIGVGLAIGLMAVNVLVVNNYRDMEDDCAVGKRTTVVIFGRNVMQKIYLVNGVLVAVFLSMASSGCAFWVSAGWLAYLVFHFSLWWKMKNARGKSLNNVLKNTSLLLFATSIYLLVIFCVAEGVTETPGDYPF